jgi:hypothetical protein
VRFAGITSGKQLGNDANAARVFQTLLDAFAHFARWHGCQHIQKSTRLVPLSQEWSINHAVFAAGWCSSALPFSSSHQQGRLWI